jgi:hypothetical protein
VTAIVTLVKTLEARGVMLRPDGDRLRVYPVEALTHDELAALREHKAAVLTLLTAPAPSPSAADDPDDIAPRRWPDLDWAHAMTTCLLCGWYGPRPAWRGHECGRTPDAEDDNLRVTVAPAGSRYFHPWPDVLPGLGRRTIDPFSPCAGCGTGTWARYGDTALCLTCAKRRER